MAAEGVDNLKKSEGRIQDEILIELSKIDGVLAQRNNVGQARMSNGSHVRYGVGGKGGSDLILCARGLYVALEIKTPKGRLSLDQERYGAAVELNGGKFIVARSAEEAIEKVMGVIE